MKRRIFNVLGTIVLAWTVCFSVVQLAAPVAHADGCPDPSTMGCNCRLTWSTWYIEYGVTHGLCHYECEICPNNGGGGNNEGFLIEQEYQSEYLFR
jgi:hypothetical protein